MIASMDDLVFGLISGDRVFYQKSAQGSITSGSFHSLWRTAGQPSAGALPPSGSGEVPTRSNPGALQGWTDASGSDVAYIAQASVSSGTVTIYYFYDRLVHTSGLNSTLLTAQTVNTPALTRYTNGKGVEAWLEVYTTLGASSRTVTISYTNQDGVSGRSGSCVVTTPPTGRMIPFNLQAGDTGVRSVETVTMSASTGTAGDFGITLLKRLVDIGNPMAPNSTPQDAFELGLPALEDNACIAMFVYSSATTAGPFIGVLTVAKG